MGRIVILISLFYSSLTFSLVPENIFQNDLEIIELLGNKINVAKNNSAIPFSIKEVDAILSDPKSLVYKDFKINDYFYKDVKFWFYIYTVFHSHHVVMHDKENLSLIYDVIEYEELKNSNLSEYTKFALQSRLTDERIKTIRKDFVHLRKNKAKTNNQKKIIAALEKVGFKIPPPSRKRTKLFKGLAKNLRTQTGQKDSIQNGIESFEIYKETFFEWLDYFKLPKELIWISFLESSFNVKAKSKVGATGVWQFMRRIGKYFMPYNKRKDGRLSPVMSTLAAFHLLHQNKKILKGWDLAIPAYNSGTKHLIKARRKLKKKRPSLEEILEKYDHPHMGFASKNFYSEFLALTHAMAYRELFYNVKNLKTSKRKINVFLTKCKIKVKDFNRKVVKRTPHTRDMNKHLKNKKHWYKRGTILFSDINLTSKKYLKLTMKQLRRKYPKNYKDYLKGHSCSTK
ncbi:MAG: membrane-bound lytic murein transglycosylase D [Bacteriovoracaceae bacterium]|jgi:membrane-bound lytic murein transglycosylase D